MFYLNRSYITNNRYDMAKFMQFNTDNYDVLNSYLLLNLKKLNVMGIHQIVDANEVGRPEYVSYAIYNDTKYWWLLLVYNDILDIADLVLGKKLNYFSLDDLETLYFNLNSSNG